MHLRHSLLKGLLRLTALTLLVTLVLLCFGSWAVFALEQAVDGAAAALPPAIPVDEQTWWHATLVPVLGIVGLVISVTLAVGLHKAVQLLEAKLNIDIPITIENLLVEKTKQLVAWGEEQAERRLLHGDGVKTPGAEIASNVHRALHSFVEDLGYGEKYSTERLTQLIEGVLHLNRAGNEGIGSTGERAALLLTKGKTT